MKLLSFGCSNTYIQGQWPPGLEGKKEKAREGATNGENRSLVIVKLVEFRK
jgi:hypothetical protein